MGKKTAKESTPVSGGKQTTYAPHALANVVPGEMGTEEFDALCVSIKEDGQRVPIVIYEGHILDGRHRYQACRKLGIEPKLEQFKGSAADAAAFAIDMNLHRRQLNSMQKALVAARMCTREKDALSQKDAAAKVGVGVATVNLAVRLLASNNTPLIKRTENGDTTRAEIDEMLFDREASKAAAMVAAPKTNPGDTDDDDNTPGKVVQFPKTPGPQVAGKVPHPERHARSTPASLAVQHFKALDEKARASFCTMAWQWLRPALIAAGKMAKGEGAPLPVAGKPLAAPKAGKRTFKKAVKATAPAAQVPHGGKGAARRAA